MVRMAGSMAAAGAVAENTHPGPPDPQMVGEEEQEEEEGRVGGRERREETRPGVGFLNLKADAHW